MLDGVGTSVLFTGGLSLIGGGATGALISYLLNRTASRRRESLQLLNQFLIDPTFRTHLTNNLEVIRRWNSGDRSILNHFVEGLVRVEPEVTFANGLTPHVTLSIILHYWAMVYQCIDLHIVEVKIVTRTLGHYFEWYAEFYNAFVDAYEEAVDDLGKALKASGSNRRQLRSEPSWVPAIHELTRIFVPSLSKPTKGQQVQ